MKGTVYRMIVKDRLVPPGEGVLVALSGGADSVVLLHLMRSLAPLVPFTLRAAHLDHGMRPESPHDAVFVRRLCAEWGVPLAVERADVPALAREQGRGLEETGREVRREFLRQTAARHGCAVIALGHHRGDQAETFLHRLLRGSGLSGLAAMRVKSGPFVRPLLPFSRRQVRDYLAEQRLGHVEDPSNRDPAYTRNRIRHQLLPSLQSFNPRIEEHLARLCRRIALEEDYWQEEGERSLAALIRPGEGGVCLDRSGLAALHPALRARVIRRALERVRGDLTGISARHVEDVEGVLLGERPQAEVHLPAAWAARRYDRLWLRRTPPPPPPPFAVPVAGPGVYPLPGGGVLEVSLVDAPRGEGALAVEFDADVASFPLLVRPFRPGDRFRPAGLGGSKKLKDFFIDAKIPLEERRRLPLVAGREILWVVGVRRCDGGRPDPAAGRVLRLAVSNYESSTNHL